ncbi:xylulose kinase [Corynebacterium diphtheriae]|nr:xylulose kinase [Corynebacterium diphtheriae]
MILAIDLGTSGAKAAIIDSAGAVHEQTFVPYSTTKLPNGGVEQDPMQWVSAARQAVTRLPRSYTVVSFTGQMQDLICLDRAGRPLGQALLYNDARAAAEAARLNTAVPEWKNITGNRQTATSTAAMWLRLMEQSDVSDVASVLFSPASFVISQLECGLVCDETTASSTGLFDIHHRCWSDDIVQACGLRMDMLPTIASGFLDTVGADNCLGLPAGTKVVLSLGDAASTTCGIVGLGAGDDFVSLGTSGWHARVVSTVSDPSEVRQFALPDGGILRIASVLSVGGTADWARSVLLPGVSAKEADALMLQRPRLATGLLSLPSIQGESFPVRSHSVGGCILGMRGNQDPLTLYTAVIEGICMTLAHDIKPGGILPATGGGARSVPWMRILASVTNRNIHVTASEDAALHGAASLAAYATSGEYLPTLAARAIVEIEPEPEVVASFEPLIAKHLELFRFAAALSY